MVHNMSKNTPSLPSAIDTKELTHEEPLDHGEFQTGRVLTVIAGHAVHDTYTAFLPPLLPAFIANLALSRTEAGLLSVFVSAPSVFQPLLGHFADRINMKALIILGPALTGMMLSILGITPTYWMMVLFLIVAGFSSAGFHATAPVMVSSLSGRRLGRGMGFWMVGGELGRALGPLLIALVIRYLDIQGMPWLIPGGLITSIILYLRLKDVPDRRPGKSESPSWGDFLNSVRPIMVPLTGLLITTAFLSSALSTYLPIYLTDEGAEIWFAGMSLSIFEVAGIVGAFLGGTISDRFGRKGILTVSTFAVPLLTFLFVSTDGWIQILLLPILGLTALSTAPIMMAILLENVPENRALANGIYMAVSFLTRSGSVVVLGLLGDRYGLGLAFQFSSIIMLLGLPIIPFLPKKRSVETIQYASKR